MHLSGCWHPQPGAAWALAEDRSESVDSSHRSGLRHSSEFVTTRRIAKETELFSGSRGHFGLVPNESMACCWSESRQRHLICSTISLATFSTKRQLEGRGALERMKSFKLSQLMCRVSTASSPPATIKTNPLFSPLI